MGKYKGGSQRLARAWHRHGWRVESERHSLAARRVKTGSRKSLYQAAHLSGFTDIAPFPVVSVREFFVKRFGRQPEEDPRYFRDWERRFATGNPEAFMDTKSLETMKVLRMEKKGLLAK